LPIVARFFSCCQEEKPRVLPLENAKCSATGKARENNSNKSDRARERERASEKGAGDFRASERGKERREAAIRNATLRILCANDKHFRAAIKITVRERERTRSKRASGQQ